jgi:hypothetical protein
MTRQIILLEPRAEDAKTIRFDLYQYFGVSALVRSTVGEISSLLELFPTIDLLVCTEHLVGELSKLKLAEVSILSYPHDRSAADVLDLVAKHLQLPFDREKYKSEHATELYKPVKLPQIMKLSESPVDLYIRIGSLETGFKFIKRVHKMDPFNPALFASMQQSGIEDVWVETLNYDLLTRSLSNQLLSALLKPSTSPLDRYKAQGSAHHYLHDFALTLNFDQSTIELVEELVATMVETTKTNNSTAELIKLVVLQKESMHFQGFYLTNLLNYYLLRCTDQLTTTKVEHLTYATLFCDLHLTGDQFLITSKDQIQSNPSGQVQENLRQHAFKNSEYIRSYPDIAPEIIKLVREHHGDEVGMDYLYLFDPQEMHEDTPLLMTTHLFVKYFLNPTYKFDKGNIITQMRQLLLSPGCQRYLDLLAQKIT